MPAGLTIIGKELFPIEELMNAILGYEYYKPILGYNFTRPIVAQRYGTQSVTTSTSTGSQTVFLFDSEETTEVGVKVGNLIYTANPNGGRYRPTMTVAKTTVTFNRIIQTLWFRIPTDKTVCITSINKDYLSAKNTKVSLLSTPGTTITFLETGEALLTSNNDKLFEIYSTGPDNQNRLIFNTSVFQTKLGHVPLTSSFDANGFFVARIFKVRYGMQNFKYPSTLDEANKNTSSTTVANHISERIDLPESWTDPSAIFIQTSDCYCTNLVNSSVGVCVKLKYDSTYKNYYLLVKYWSEAVQDMYGVPIVDSFPYIPAVNPAFNWDALHPSSTYRTYNQVQNIKATEKAYEVRAMYLPGYTV